MAERDGRYLSWYNQMESQKQTGGLERSNSHENCLVGGLEHYVVFYPFSWEFHHPN